MNNETDFSFRGRFVALEKKSKQQEQLINNCKIAIGQYQAFLRAMEEPFIEIADHAYAMNNGNPEDVAKLVDMVKEFKRKFMKPQQPKEHMESSQTPAL